MRAPGTVGVLWAAAGLLLLGVPATLLLYLRAVGQEQAYYIKTHMHPYPHTCRRAPSEECRGWVFERYHPSTLEAEWRARIEVNQADVCARFVHAYADLWQGYVDACPQLAPDDPAKAPSSSCAPGPRAGFQESVFSKFEYRNTCGGGNGSQASFVFVEPLAGALRHPLFCTDDRYLLNRNYMLLDGWRGSSGGRFFYFDVGASTWNSGPGGASQSWIHATYGNLCVQFDHIYAWEAGSQDTGAVMAEIPPEVVGKYHWFNIPASAERLHKHNPLSVLLSETTPEDWVVLKLDVDNWQVEEELVRQILASCEISARIDEMFWEHHVRFAPMTSIWWTGSYNPSSSMEYSLLLFHALRERGIRAHSWP